MTISRLFFSVFVLSLVVRVTVAEPMKIFPSQNWVGKHDSNKLKKLAPKEGLIVEAKAFEKLWKAWRSDEKVPEIDFTKEFVLVTLADGPNRLSIHATVEDGKMKVTSVQTLIGGDGFGYSLAKFPRKGITSVNGKKLPEK
jgi:hypothetical protein